MIVLKEGDKTHRTYINLLLGLQEVDFQSISLRLYRKEFLSMIMILHHVSELMTEEIRWGYS